MLSGQVLDKSATDTNAGDWVNTKCSRHNIFICEVILEFDLAKLTGLVIDLRKKTTVLENEVKDLKGKEVNEIKELSAEIKLAKNSK